MSQASQAADTPEPEMTEQQAAEQTREQVESIVENADDNLSVLERTLETLQEARVAYLSHNDDELTRLVAKLSPWPWVFERYCAIRREYETYGGIPREMMQVDFIDLCAKTSLAALLWNESVTSENVKRFRNGEKDYKDALSQLNDVRHDLEEAAIQFGMRICEPREAGASYMLYDYSSGLKLSGEDLEKVGDAIFGQAREVDEAMAEELEKADSSRGVAACEPDREGMNKLLEEHDILRRVVRVCHFYEANAFSACMATHEDWGPEEGRLLS